MAGKELLKDSRGKLLGWTIEQGSKRFLYNQSGMLLGWYDKSVKATFDYRGIRQGYGDVLTMLFKTVKK